MKNKKMNVFMKVKAVRELLKKELGKDFSHDEITGICQRIFNNFHYKKKKKRLKLSEIEAKVYEVLMNNSYNPGTVYRWLLVAECPYETKQKILNKQINFNDALKEKRTLKTLNSTSDREFIDAVIDSVERYIIK